ncbi:MAG: TadE/TadG family type IV pilus assembly protein [Acidimicrobiia bacterium]
MRGISMFGALMRWFRGEEIRDGRERGATLVEVAFVLPLILVLVLGVVDYGFMINRGSLVNNATT